MMITISGRRRRVARVAGSIATALAVSVIAAACASSAQDTFSQRATRSITQGKLSVWATSGANNSPIQSSIEKWVPAERSANCRK